MSPSRLGNVLKLLSRERKRPVFSDFHHRLLTPKGSHHSDRSLTGIIHSVHWLGKASHRRTSPANPLLP